MMIEKIQNSRRMSTVVLLSTYNGERYLREQIDSVLNQRGVDVKLLVRDDGSTDATTNILNEYQEKGRLTWFGGDNLGPAHSFMHLLLHANEKLCLSETADCMYAFCDQDDVWDEDKLSAAISLMGTRKNNAVFYASQIRAVDQCLQPLPTPVLSPFMSVGESLVYSFITGCTVVMNAKMRCMVLLKKMPPTGVLHDYWCYLVAQAVGATVVFDVTPHISYRQHGHNVVGMVDTSIEQWKRRFVRFFSGSADIRSKTAAYLLREYAEWMPIEVKQIVQLFTEGKTSFYKRWRILWNPCYKTGSKRTTFNFKMAVWLNTY